MFVSILSLLILIGLVVLFVWLTYRALRSNKLWVKIVGGAFGALCVYLHALTPVIKTTK